MAGVARLAALALAALAPLTASAAAREVTPLEGPWRFELEGAPAAAQAPGLDDERWTSVPVPHTWGKDAHRAAWYRLHFTRTASPGRRVYVVFDGVSTLADVYLNGTHLGTHMGAYTRFLFDATAALKDGDNVLAVKVSNHGKDTAESLPSGMSKILYWPYGGIYRRAYLLETGPEHVDPTDHAASGVFLTPTKVTAASAQLAVRTLLRNTSKAARTLEVRHRVTDPDGAEVLALTKTVRVPADGRATAEAVGTVAKPRLWGFRQPNLYTVVTQVVRDGEVVDEVTEKTGFRTFTIQPDGSFRLNGAKVLLRGVGKHQETEHGLSVMSDDEIREDFRNLDALGVNVVRLAHYPHAQLAYELADAQGLLVWAENGHSNPQRVGPTGERITLEMVRQLYNHPSIVMWSVGNENAYMRVPVLAQMVKNEDPTRLVTYASNTGQRRGKRYQALDFVAANAYPGWYYRQPWEFEANALQFHYISESGGGEVITNHDEYGNAGHVVDQFEPEEYRQTIAEAQFQTVFRNHPDAVPMYLVWILRDFGIDKYKGVVNTKGLLTGANFPKDAYWLYRSFLKPEEPLVYVTSKPWFLRNTRPRNGIKVYSNRNAVRLRVNGEDKGLLKNGAYRHKGDRRIDNVFYWPVLLAPGRNVVRAEDEDGHFDEAVIYQAGEAAADTADPIRDLASSNPASPATFVRLPVQEQWPFYREFDGTADNTWDVLPGSIRGASWIATPRLSKPEARTDLSFRVADAPVRVFVACDEAAVAHFVAAGFQEAKEEGRWRGNDLAAKPFRVVARDYAADARVEIPGTTADYVVLVK